VAGSATAPIARRTQSNARQVSLVAPSVSAAQNGTVTVALQAQGDENALAFSLSFDPAKVVFTAANASDAATGVTLNVNAKQATQGRVGLVLALGAGRTFAAGSKQLVNISFRPLAATSGTAAISFADQPVARGIADPAAELLAADYINGSVVVNPLPALRITTSGSDVMLAWPTSAAGFSLQQSTDSKLSAGSWTAVPSTPSTANNENVVTVPAAGTIKFYRLYHQ
jgi:hypothetical protein